MVGIIGEGALQRATGEQGNVQHDSIASMMKA